MTRRRIASLALMSAAAVLLFFMQRTTPRYLDLTGPIPVYGTMHGAVTTRLFDINVDRVVFARQLSFDRFGRTEIRTTSGLWAVVTVSLAARTASTRVGEASWVGPTGLRYQHTDRLSLAPGLPPHAIDPGLPRQGQFVFEIRPDQAVGARLLVSTGFSPRLDSEARVALNNVPTGPGAVPIVLDTLALGRQPQEGS